MSDKTRKSFAYLTIGFLVMALLMLLDELYKQAVLNVIVASLFGIAYLRSGDGRKRSTKQ
jgi:hypothetical protein